MAEYTWKQWEQTQDNDNVINQANCERWQAGIELAGGSWSGSFEDGKDSITIDEFNALESQIQSKVSSYTPKNYDPDSTVQIVPGPDGWNKVEDGLIKAICQPDGTNINVLTNSNTNVRYTAANGTSYTAEQGITVEEWGATDANRFYGTSGSATSGSDSNLMYRNFETSTSEQNYTLSVYVKNTGDNPIRVRLNGIANSAAQYSDYIESGEQTKIVISGVGSGTAYIQVAFRALNENTDFDFIWWHPKIELSDTATDWTPCPTDYGYPSTTLSASATPQSVEDSDEVAAPEAEEIE